MDLDADSKSDEDFEVLEQVLGKRAASPAAVSPLATSQRKREIKA